MKITAFCDYYIGGSCEAEVFDGDFLPNGNVSLASMIRVLLELECIENTEDVDAEVFENGVSLYGLLDLIEARLGEGYVEIDELS